MKLKQKLIELFKMLSNNIQEQLYFLYGVVFSIPFFMVFKHNLDAANSLSSLVIFSISFLRQKLNQKYNNEGFSWKYILIGMFGWLFVAIISFFIV